MNLRCVDAKVLVVKKRNVEKEDEKRRGVARRVMNRNAPSRTRGNDEKESPERAEES